MVVIGVLVEDVEVVEVDVEAVDVTGGTPPVLVRNALGCVVNQLHTSCLNVGLSQLRSVVRPDTPTKGTKRAT